MNLLLYQLFLRLYFTGIKVLSLWNEKAKLWVKGRKNFPQIQYSAAKDKLVWMHCASLGEFEQGRPVMEAVKEFYPSCKIVLSFFSPSGYEIVKNFKGADHIIYLPEDSAANAKKLIDQINPSLVLWVKYEYWFYYLAELKKRNIPTLLISAVYRDDMIFFKWYGALWKKMLGCFTHFFVQNSSSEINLKKLVEAGRVSNSGDTRFDRVCAIAKKFEPLELIEKFCGESTVIVAGSTWEDDEAEWIHYVKTHPEIKFIIAPHEIDKENLADIKKEFPTAMLYSEWAKANGEWSMVNGEWSMVNGQLSNVNSQSGINCLIIDNIGMLSRLYKYATICYIGGGFGSDGLHNILEAAVYAKPVLFGPEYYKNFEAVEMIEAAAAISINNALELEKVLDHLLRDSVTLHKMGQAAGIYVANSSGATNKIMEFIRKNAFLPTDQTASQRDQHPSSQF